MHCSLPLQDAVQKLVKEAENISRSKVSTITLKEVLNSVSGNQAEQIIRKHLQGKWKVNDLRFVLQTPLATGCICVIPTNDSKILFTPKVAKFAKRISWSIWLVHSL